MKKSALLFCLLLLSGVAYYTLAYQTLRENFLQVISLFIFLFAAYYVAYTFFSITHFNLLLIAGLLFRLLLVFSVPNLSDDVYRFIWDGRMVANGINPFSHLPSEIMTMQPLLGITPDLFHHLNSPNYYTIYPPVLQGIFWLTAKLFPVNVFASIVFMKCVIVMAEAGVIYLMMQLLIKLLLPKHLSLLYVLNPLVITELTGNVHFESVMILFVLLAFLLLLQNSWQTSAFTLGLGIATKLIPVLFLPLMICRLGWRKRFMYSLISGIIALILFALVFNVESARHLIQSANLFIQHFEFNASIYYVARWIGDVVIGYNIITHAGPVLYLLAACLIVYLSFRDKNKSARNIFITALFIITTWYLFATTVHPWYICLPIALSVFTPYRFAIVWSFTAILSYAAYRTIPVHENLWLIGSGYVVMIGYAIWELKFRKQFPSASSIIGA